MPTILLQNGFRFFFYANEHLPIHIHVSKGDAIAKIELDPEIDIIYNRSFKPREIKQIVDIIVENYEYLIEQWHETFN